MTNKVKKTTDNGHALFENQLKKEKMVRDFI